MSEQQWKLVPVEPTEEMRKAIFGLLSAHDDGSDITPSFFMKMLLNAAPQPPALGGEPEPFGLIYRDGSNAIIQLVGDPHIKDGMPVYGESEVARLQAEVERLKDVEAALINWGGEVVIEREKFKARTAALEGLLHEAWGYDIGTPLRRRIRAALAEGAKS